MYEKHFKFERKPFEQLPDPEFLFLTDQHDEALTRMQLALAINDSFVVVTGEIGSGKTTLVRKMLSELPQDNALAFVTHTRVSDTELLQLILVEFGIRPFGMGKVEMLFELRHFIETQHAAGRRVIIVVDEAQNLGLDVLEELRLLTCLDSAKEKAFNIVLVGQPQLSRLLDSPELEQLRQRCRLRFHLHSLSKEQTREYIDHRLSVAMGKPSTVFDEDAEAAVYNLTGGVPRLINTLCDTALVMAYVGDSEDVTRKEVNEASAELGWTDTKHAPAMADNAQAKSAATLTLRKDAKLVSEIRLHQSSYVIGRADDCSIIIDSKFLSRHHAIMSHDGTAWTISDLRSTNGVRVNGRAIKARTLRDGDVIAIGAHHMIFRQPDAVPSESATATEGSGPRLMAETQIILDDEVASGGKD